MPANVVGKPVRGGDFFNRSREVVDMWSRLETDNILLLAPRRVGKTSLMYRLQDEALSRRFLPTFVSVADAASELAFTQRLYKQVQEHRPAQRVIASILSSIAADPRGATRDTLLSMLSKHVPDLGQAEHRLHELLDVLRSDGYVVEQDGRITFRSPMLRDFWRQRVMP